MNKYLENDDYIYIYKRVNTYANIILREYKINELEANNLLTILNIYKKKILNINPGNHALNGGCFVYPH